MTAKRINPFAVIIFNEIVQPLNFLSTFFQEHQSQVISCLFLWLFRLFQQ